MSFVETVRKQLIHRKLKFPPEERSQLNIGFLFTLGIDKEIFQFFNEMMHRFSRIDLLTGEFEPRTYRKIYHILILSHRVFVSEMDSPNPPLSTFTTELYFDSSVECITDDQLGHKLIDSILEYGEFVTVDIDENGRKKPKYEHNTWGHEEFDYFPAITSLIILN